LEYLNHIETQISDSNSEKSDIADDILAFKDGEKSIKLDKRTTRQIVKLVIYYLIAAGYIFLMANVVIFLLTHLF